MSKCNFCKIFNILVCVSWENLDQNVEPTEKNRTAEKKRNGWRIQKEKGIIES